MAHREIHMNKLSTKDDVEKFIKDGIGQGDDNILMADAPPNMGFADIKRDSVIYISVSEANKSEFIKSFRKEKLYNNRKTNAEQQLKQSYKEAVDADVDVRFTANWFGEMNDSD